MMKRIMFKMLFVFTMTILYEEMLEFDDTGKVWRRLMRHECKIAARAAAVQTGDLARFSRIDAYE